MLTVFSKTGTVLGMITEYESILALSRFSEPGELTAMLPASAYELIADPDAYFLTAGGDDEVYLNEASAFTPKKSLEVKGRSASALLELRTVFNTTLSWAAPRPGQVMSALFAHLASTSRTLPLAMGSDTTTGTLPRLQRSWGDLLTIATEVLAAGGAGMRTRWSGSSVVLDCLMPADTGEFIGEKFTGDGATIRIIKDKRGWHNFAYVLGEGEGSERVLVTVDQRGGAESRELYVDARDLQQGDLTYAQYTELLITRGREKLAETRRLDYVECSDLTLADFRPGDVVTYAEDAFTDSFMVTEREVVYEGGQVTRRLSLGPPPPQTLAAIMRRQQLR